jgi:hypothetical protein
MRGRRAKVCGGHNCAGPALELVAAALQGTFWGKAELTNDNSERSVAMATSARRVIKQVEDSGEELSGNIAQQIASLRKEIAAIADAVSDYGGSSLGDVQHNALALAKEVRHQGTVVARQVGRQANAASKVVQENPVPVIVALGTIALISALIFSRD